MQLIGWIAGVMFCFWVNQAHAAQCNKHDLSIVISDGPSRVLQVVRFSNASDRDAAFSKCLQLTSIHVCSKIGTNMIESYAEGERAKQLKMVEIYGHTLQNSFAQLVRYGWGELNDCNKDLVLAIAKMISY
jgi:hypothetical protein